MHTLQIDALTSQVAYEVIQAHFALGFDVGRVHVSVEEDHSKCQDEDSVWVVKLLHYIWIAHTVPLAVEEKHNIVISQDFHIYWKLQKIIYYHLDTETPYS